MHDQENVLNNMVRMCFEEAGKISMMFNTPENVETLDNENSNVKSRVVSAKEVKFMKDGKVYHAKQISDSLNPKNNKKVVFRNDLDEEED